MRNENLLWEQSLAKLYEIQSPDGNLGDVSVVLSSFVIVSAQVEWKVLEYPHRLRQDEPSVTVGLW